MDENLYARLVNTARDAIIVIDECEKIVLWNQAAVNEFGYEESEALGSNLHQLIMPERYQLAHKQAAIKSSALLDKKPSRLVEVIAKRKDGSEFPVEVSLSSTIVDGEWRAVGFVRNITDRRKREEQIRKLSGAVEQSPSTVVITDTLGNIEYINPKFTVLSGYNLSDIVGKNPKIFNSGKNSEKVYKNLWKTIKEGSEWRGELLNKKKNGELYWEHASITALRDEEGTITHYLKVSEEITERKRAEQALRDAKKAAVRASEAKSEFLANMSHEIRTPMNVIIGLTNHILEKDIEHEQREHLNMINDSAKLLLSIINQILDFTKVEAGKLELKKQPFELLVTIERLIKILEMSAKERGIALRLEYGHGIPAVVSGDSVRLQQILINLIGNAIKFTDGGHVTIAVSLVKVDTDAIRIAFSVKDTGIGIPAENLNQLFQSFSQVDSSLARQYEGTGLGLAISKKLVELMDGSIGVKSEVGEGSDFYFDAVFERVSSSAPEYEPHDLEHETHSIENNETKNKATQQRRNQAHILLAEDKRMNQILAKTILEKKGWQVTIVSNGIRALEALENDRFDIVLMDIQMPEMDGIETTRMIRSWTNHKNMNVPVIAMTANAMAGDREKFLEQGMDDYIGKPFDTNELYAVIEKHLGNRV